MVINCGSPEDRFFSGGFPYAAPGGPLRYGAFSYHIPMPSGVYLLTLTFRETGTIAAANQRRFSVAVNRLPVLTNYDLFAEAGLSPKHYNYVVTSNDGFIDLALTYSLRSAVLANIEIQTLFSA